jgi:hypothetical protein
MLAEGKLQQPAQRRHPLQQPPIGRLGLSHPIDVVGQLPPLLAQPPLVPGQHRKVNRPLYQRCV